MRHAQLRNQHKPSSVSNCISITQLPLWCLEQNKTRNCCYHSCCEACERELPCSGSEVDP
jgi:hypothetical protein